MIRVEGLSKRYGDLQVLEEVDLEFRPDGVTAVLGPNGAGKTTLIKCVLGLVRPDAGTIDVLGHTVDGSGEYRRHIGYMPQIPRYPENLTVREILAMIQDLRGRRDDPDLDEELVRAFGLEREFDKPFRTLSGGNRQRISASLAFMFGPEILLLDEPTAGLDPVSSSAVKDRVRRERDEGRTVVLTSHVMSEVEQLAERVVYLMNGRIQFDASVASLMRETEAPNLERAIARLMEVEDAA